MPTDVVILRDRIAALLDEPAEPNAAAVAEVERTLTDGYAQAHVLEAERRRIDRRIAALAADAQSKADELGELAKRSDRVAKELVRLRELLADLRRLHAATAPPG